MWRVRPSVRHFYYYNLFYITGKHIEVHIQFTFVTSMTLILSRSANLYISLHNLYHISISPIAPTNFKMGTHAKSGSLRPKCLNISNHFLSICNIWKTVPDS